MPREGELVVVQIDDVDIASRRVTGTTNQEGLINIYFREYPGGMLLIPKQGDFWLVVRRGWDWYLEKKLDNDEEHQDMITNMGQGDMRLKAAGSIRTQAESVHVNGRAWGATIRDTFHDDVGYTEVVLSHDPVSADTIHPILNGVLIPASQWSFFPDERAVRFVTTMGELGYLTVDYQTWMTNNDDVGSVTSRAIISADESFEDN